MYSEHTFIFFQNPHVAKRFFEDFDFEAMNEKFNKKEVWDFLGRSSKAESDEGIGVEKEMDESDAEDVTEDGSAKHDYKVSCMWKKFIFAFTIIFSTYSSICFC